MMSNRVLIDLVFIVTFTNVYAVIPIIVFALCLKVLVSYYIRTYREVIRLESITKSPVCTYFKETCQGLT